MRSRLDARHYVSPEVLAREQERIFRRLWIFAGFRTLLSAPDAFITHRIGGEPIVVQNGRDGVLRAFVNRCAHRQAPVQLEDFGQRRLACPYHGWTYDDLGQVKSIPGREANYGFSDACVADLRLQPVALRCIGNLVFVNLDREPMPMEAQFHESFLRRLEEVSAYLDDEALFATFEGGYNWKLNFENVVDWNHVRFVHAASFAPLMGLPRTGVAQPVALSEPPVPDEAIGDDLRDLSYEVAAPFEFRPWPWHGLVDRFCVDELYFNFFLYPNVNFISMAGAIFLTQQFMPAAPDRTEVRLTMCTARKKAKLPALPAILWAHLRSEKHVIDEDIRVLEGLQRGLAEGNTPVFHGAYESKLRSIAKVYLKLIADGPR